MMLRFLSFLLIPVAILPAATVEARKVPILTVAGQRFKDLNKNGKLDKYEDWRLPVAERVADLLSQMTVEEKAGLMIHTSLMGFTGPGGIVLDAPAAPPPGMASMIRLNPLAEKMDNPTPSEVLFKRNIRWILVRPNRGETPDTTARFHNGMQELAETSRLGIPIVFSSDPRHSTPRVQITPQGGATVSQWPEQIGFAAIGDAETVRNFGRIAARELRAIGIQTTLSPMADITTEPRWNRVIGTFGENVETVSKLTAAYIEGFQGTKISPASVLCVTKHFPGDGPVKEGFDPHNDYGKMQVYPGKNLEQHLVPFKAAFKAGTGGIMPGYAIPEGIDTVGMNFSKVIVKDMLREKFDYDGLVVTDWLRNMPWGVEGLNEQDRQLKIVEAGVDQIGGDNDPKYILKLVKEGKVTEARITESARRVLKPMFDLGVFENPYVDPDAAAKVVGSAEHNAAGMDAQRKSVVLVKNNGVLPLKAGAKVYVENLSKAVAARYGTVVESPVDATVILVGATAPFATHKGGASFFRGAKEGTLAYEGADNAQELATIRKLAATGKPVVVVMYMDRPPVLSEFIDSVAAVMGHFGSSDAALFDVISGKVKPVGKLPFDLPGDMASVEANKEDVAHDFKNTLFKTGFGLTYK